MTLSPRSPDVARRRGRAGPRIRPARLSGAQFVCTAVERPDEREPAPSHKTRGRLLARFRLRYSLRGFSRNPAAHEVARVVALVLLKVALVVFLRAPEPGGWHDLGDDRLLEVGL